ncbi:CBS domain-containing protein [Pediococcus argentinicus]|uniref:Acetoin utilization protein, CBS domain protein n=1 Tax=Pediococcus argentinicus TaxID=480391 RepID=A0A0R2NJH3_9LACO|nr:CBS domain-containing protein [Pediococcus argentinicus]KRO23066.1 acetoin utilization protein, CBS domain protein [Pediococcus argentinicus]NKZ22950.1 CBS domain-containing protein [Pediococcus argentinicus]GEP20021.1 acetoin utilization protein AcuB [Pediococcus argentinicus]
MSVADFMTKDIQTVAPDTKISVAVDLMNQNKIHRLPVIDDGKLVGIITQRDIERTNPSQATSLSIYEVNYLLNNMTVNDVMTKEVKTISADAFLEDAIYQMRQNQIGVLPVMDGSAIVGIITNNDILDAFLDVTDYHEQSTVVQIFVEHDQVGVIFKVGQIMAENNFNIQTLMVTHQNGVKVVEIHVDPADKEVLVEKLKQAGFNAKAAENYKEWKK